METIAAGANRAVPAWFDEAKLGIFIHWTAAAIPAFAPVPQSRALDPVGVNPENFDPDDPDKLGSPQMWRTLPFAEMYQNSMAIPGSATARYHEETYGDLPYDAFVEKFRTEMIPGWDPEPWADLFAQVGARYVVLCTKIEDGFLLWSSDHRNPHKGNWQSDRDVVGELADAVRKRDLRFGTYYSGGFDWTFGGLPVHDGLSYTKAMPQGEDYRAYVEAHWRELITRYWPSILWNDYGKSPRGADLAGLFRWYREQVPDGLVNDRFDTRRQTSGELPADFVTPEYATEGPAGRKWEACRGLGNSFGYNRQETDSDYLSATELIHLFVDIVARGGNLLINVGPTASGAIPWAQAQRLLALGQWLRVNGDAIYGTRPWERFGGLTDEGLHIRYTAGRKAVYAIILGTPRTAAVELDVQLDEGAEVSLVGRHGTLRWQRTPIGVCVELPEPPDRRPGFSLRLTPPATVRAASET